MAIGARPASGLIEAVNAVIGKKYGFRIEATASHEKYYANWYAPEWLSNNENELFRTTWELVQRKADKNKTSFTGRKLSGPNKGSNIDTKAPQSDSEYEEIKQGRR